MRCSDPDSTPTGCRVAAGAPPGPAGRYYWVLGEVLGVLTRTPRTPASHLVPGQKWVRRRKMPTERESMALREEEEKLFRVSEFPVQDSTVAFGFT